MILIDALFVNNGGGKVLLDYLIDKLESTNKSVCYLLDKRIKSNHPLISKNNSVVYLKAGLVERHYFYFKHRNRYSTILCFGNVPPSLRMNAFVYTYLHQALYFNTPDNIGLFAKLLFKLKSYIVRRFQIYTDFWIVQSKAMSNSLSKKIVEKASILVIPFYPKLNGTNQVLRVDKSFLYVSAGSEHKNHKTLLKGFVHFIDRYGVGKLHLTVDQKYSDLYEYLQELIQLGYPIINHGYVERSKLKDLYNSVEYVVYPSLSESFGLGLIEALENNCNVIGANLSYTFAVCIPSLTFDPYDFRSISESFLNAVNGNVKKSKQLVFDEIEDLVNLLK